MRLLLATASIALTVATAHAQAIYPIDRAEILAGSRFDFKVEFTERMAAADVRVTINGADHSALFGRAGTFVERETGFDQSALILRDAVLDKPGEYRIRVSQGANSSEVTWNVYATGPRRARNVILFIGDGLSPAHRVAARHLSKGVAEGKAKGKLAIDDMPNMAMAATASTDSIITDSANSMSAYTTGHKAAVNAMGVYADRTADPLDDPKVETITSLVQRLRGMAVGIVTNTALADATPAAMVAHTRRRSTFDEIVAQMFAARPDVVMGGGAVDFLPRGQDGGRRRDGVDYVARFRDAGYTVATTATELNALAGAQRPAKLLGLFNPGNMDGVLDRKFLKAGTVKKFPDQPDLTDQVRVALDVLSQRPEGFVLMVESGLIDKYTHVLDMERAVYDTIMLDNAVKLARDWAAARGDDTLIVVAPDHSHPISLIGTIDDDMGSTPNVPLRERIGIYDKAKFPNYPAPDADGYPPRVDVSRRLAIFSASSPDYYETFRPKLDEPNEPAVKGAAPGTFEANERYRSQPGAMLRLGNLPKYINSSVHAAEDVIVTATGPGSDRVRGNIENTDVFRIIVDALGLAHGAKD